MSEDIMNKQRRAAVEAAKSLLWTPYVWGGKNPMVALDCSGFVQAVLSEPIVGSIMNRTPAVCSADQSNLFPEIPEEQSPTAGCLVFYGEPEKIKHVMMCLDDKWAIGAAGGNSECDAVVKAMKIGACVKILPINYRNDIVKITDPFLKGDL